MTVRRNVVICKETEKASLVKFRHSKKTAWIPKQYITIVEKHEFGIEKLKYCKIEIPAWVFAQLK